VAAALAIGMAACGGGGSPPAPDAPEGPTWWQPQVGQAKNWDIQLSAVDVSMPRLMYDLDLWALVPSPTKLDYGDDKPVMVPAGALAGTIAQLHARTPSTIVICHVETGLWELSRPDAVKFPGYNADPAKIPDNPDAPAPGTVTGDPAPGSVIGWNLGSADQRLLDTSAAARQMWAPIMFKRFDLARQIGCDGIEPAHNDAAVYASGFTVKTEDTFAWYAEVAMQGHTRMLSTGMKGGDQDQLGGLIDMAADQFDWLMIERCGEHKRCDRAQPFLQVHKPVFAIDYNIDDGTEPDPPRNPMPQDSKVVCPEQDKVGIADGIYKDVPPTNAVWASCPDVGAPLARGGDPTP
jgi:hypothetical protein